MNDKPKLDDLAFMKRLGELGGNKSALGRELQISSVAIAKRWKKLLNSEAGSRGKLAAVIGASMKPYGKVKPGDRSGIKAELIDAEQRVTYELDVLGMLVESSTILQDLLKEMRADILKNGKIKPFERQDLIKISEKQASLAKIYLECQASAYNTKSVRLFIDLVLEVLGEESHDLQRKVLGRIRSAESLFNSIFGATSSPGE
jgi:rRNA processing protein Gar1